MQLENKLKEITDKLKEVKELFELKTTEANQAKELFIKLKGQAELVHQMIKEKKNKKEK
tara:strand:- start:530 stop:706 length:177 start_codon:yes stop_codon:yes gene_type:complete